MQNFQLWPPPDWVECVILWDYLLDSPVHPQDLYNWCDDHPSTSRYHVHGWQSTQGFAFRFEDPRDAILFKLKWTHQ
jgi:hypothetical protein